MPFLCPHVTCQLSRVRLCQAPSSLTPTHNRPLSPASIQPSIGHSAQPHSRPPCLPFLVTLHATLPQEACHSPSQSGFLIQLLMQLSHRTAHSAYCPYCPSHSHPHSKAHSRLLSFILLTHLSYSCSSFLTCSRTLILVTDLAFSLHGILSFATLTLRRTPPSTLSSHSPSIHLPLSRHPC